jgi:hypothetical protein
MANYYTHFMIRISNTTLEESEWLRDYFADETEDEDGNTQCQGLELTLDAGSSAYIKDDGDSGDVDKAVDCLRLFLAAHRPNDSLFVSWANTCDKHRADAFSGGAAAVTAKRVAWFNPLTMAEAWVKDNNSVTPFISNYSTTIDDIKEALNDKEVPSR